MSVPSWGFNLSMARRRGQDSRTLGPGRGTRARTGVGLGHRVASRGKGQSSLGAGGWGLGPAEPSPEVLDADHLAPGPGPVHGPPVRICALVRRGPCECSAHAAPTAPARAPRSQGSLAANQQGDSRQIPLLCLAVPVPATQSEWHRLWRDRGLAGSGVGERGGAEWTDLHLPALVAFVHLTFWASTWAMREGKNPQLNNN